MNLRCDICDKYLYADIYCEDCIRITKKNHKLHGYKNLIKGEWENGNIVRDNSTDKATYGLVD